MNKKTICAILVVVSIILVASLTSCKQTDHPIQGGYYKVLVTDNELIYLDPITTEVIHREEVDWDHPSQLEQRILEDNR